jgi:hypothetical protein
MNIVLNADYKKTDTSVRLYKMRNYTLLIQPQPPDFSFFSLNNKLLAASRAGMPFEVVHFHNHSATDIARQSLQVSLSVGVEESARLTFFASNLFIKEKNNNERT